MMLACTKKYRGHEGPFPYPGGSFSSAVCGFHAPRSQCRATSPRRVSRRRATPEGTYCRRTDAGRRRRDRIQELAANHALDVVRRYLTGLPIG